MVLNKRSLPDVNDTVLKKPAAILSFVLSVMIITQPVFPFLEYYTFKAYIVKNLCINRDKPGSCCEGKCYLEKQLKEANADNDSQKEKAPANSKVKNIEFNLPFVCSLGVFARDIINTELSYINSNYLFEYSRLFFRPPESDFS